MPDRGFWSGESTKGEYLHTLTAVDIDTRWCELSVLPNRGQQAVKDVIERMRGRLPFPLLGLDPESDSAFLNWNLTRYRSSFPRSGWGARGVQRIRPGSDPLPEGAGFTPGGRGGKAKLRELYRPLNPVELRRRVRRNSERLRGLHKVILRHHAP